MTDQPDIDEKHQRPEGADDATVEAAGKVREALEWIERARGRLYDFHQLIGHADLVLDEAVEALRSCGQDAWADRLVDEVVGRNVLDGRWTFQVVEEFDDGYYGDIRRYERDVRDGLVGGERHLFEAQLKARRRSDGRAGHEAGPPRRD
jgi:hypothetical protein